jgi:hypothetical protein
VQPTGVFSMVWKSLLNSSKKDVCGFDVSLFVSLGVQSQNCSPGEYSYDYTLCPILTGLFYNSAYRAQLKVVIMTMRTTCADFLSTSTFSCLGNGCFFLKDIER